MSLFPNKWSIPLRKGWGLSRLNDFWRSLASVTRRSSYYIFIKN